MAKRDIEEFMYRYKDPDIIDLPKEIQLQMYKALKPSLSEDIVKGKIIICGTGGEIDNTNWNLDEMDKS